MEQVTLNTIHKDLKFLKKTIVEMKFEISELKDTNLEVKPEYLEKLRKIEKEPHFEFNDINDLRQQIEG